MGIWSTLYFQFDLRASFQKIFFLHIVQRDNALVGVDILQLYGVGNQCWHPSKGWCRYQPKAYTWTPSLCPNPFISKSSHSWIIYFCMWWCCMGKISINDYASLFWPKIQIYTKIATNCFDIKKFYADLGLFISLNPQNRTNAHLNILILSSSSLLKSAPRLSWQQFSPPPRPLLPKWVMPKCV